MLKSNFLPEEHRPRLQQYFEAMFPGQISIPAVKAGASVGYAAQTTRNKINNGSFPISTFMIGGKRMVLKEDVINFVMSRIVGSPTAKKRGAPTKADRIAKAANQKQGGANGRD